ncbi:MAG: Hsp20/alpha crystallin family protein [Chloroflexi bacterium]|nr:Hsp20/alpha crystallin family protein [Chloroflexota bacterium]
MSSEKREERGLAARLEREVAPWGNDFDRFFERVMGGFGLRSWRVRPWLWQGDGWMPEIDVVQEEDKIIVRADLPGMRREDIQVHVEGDTLFIQGCREEKKEMKREDYYRAERAAGEFYRAIRLPKDTDPSALQATYKDGVLEVVAPAPKAAIARRVPVSVK